MAIGRACRDAGVPRFSPHALRHRRISLLHKDGVSWAEIGDRVGQRSRLVTADTYTHALLDYREIDRAELLGRVRAVPPPCPPHQCKVALLQGCSSPAQPTPKIAAKAAFSSSPPCYGVTNAAVWSDCSVGLASEFQRRRELQHTRRAKARRPPTALLGAVADAPPRNAFGHRLKGRVRLACAGPPSAASAASDAPGSLKTIKELSGPSASPGTSSCYQWATRALSR
jgi:hypothetical protein